MRGYNFSSGPAALPLPVLERARDEMLEWGDERASVMEISHRGKGFVAMAEQAEQDLRELMSVPNNYRILFLQGGATAHFSQIPMNFSSLDRQADYVLTGSWSEKAAKEAKFNTKVKIIASAASENFTMIPDFSTWNSSSDAAYLHYTSNETIHGVEFHHIPNSGDVPLIADMSSNILSRPLDVSKFGMIYAGAQKNLGPSGLVVAIIRDDLLEKSNTNLPAIFRYAANSAEKSLLNTPPTFSWYLAGLVFQWVKNEGGVRVMGEHNAQKAALLYDYIDQSGFYTNPVAKNARSRMNVPFRLRDEALDAVFLKESEAIGLMALKGHRSVGGMRASIYNAMPLSGVQALIEFMQDFVVRHG